MTVEHGKVTDPTSLYFGEIGKIIRHASSEDSRTILEFESRGRRMFEPPYWTPVDDDGIRKPGQPVKSPAIQHTLTVWNAVDVPDAVRAQVMALIDSYNPDIYSRDCDETGKCIS